MFNAINMLWFNLHQVNYTPENLENMITEECLFILEKKRQNWSCAQQKLLRLIQMLLLEQLSIPA